MPIINITPPTPPTPQQLLQMQATNYTSQINSQYQQIVGLFTRVKNFIWSNPNLTPQQAFDLFGTNAGDLLKVSAAFVALVATYTGTTPSVVPAGWTLVTNTDGTVTATAPVSVKQDAAPAVKK